MWGLELVRNKETKEQFPYSVQMELAEIMHGVGLQNGVALRILPRYGHLIFLVYPPLIINREEIGIMISAIEKAIDAAERHLS